MNTQKSSKITLEVTPKQLKLMLQVFKVLSLSGGEGCPELFRYLCAETKRYQAMKRNQLEASLKGD